MLVLRAHQREVARHVPELDPGAVQHRVLKAQLHQHQDYREGDSRRGGQQPQPLVRQLQPRQWNARLHGRMTTDTLPSINPATAALSINRILTSITRLSENEVGSPGSTEAGMTLMPRRSTTPFSGCDRRSPEISAFCPGRTRSEEHTSELQSHSFISYAVFCLK